jgi:transposase-like protein
MRSSPSAARRPRVSNWVGGPAGEQGSGAAGNAAGIPAIIAAAGEEAIRAYREYLEDPGRSCNTRANYRHYCRRFLDWAAEHGLTLRTITRESIAAYRDEIAARYSMNHARIFLTPVRGVFWELATAGVLGESPFDRPEPLRRQRHTSRPPADGFPLLRLMAMLANMEEQSLEVVLNDDETAENLLEFVRWRDGRQCIRCGASDEGSVGTIAGSVHQYRCDTCGDTYSVTDGTPFDAAAMTLKDGLYLMHGVYCTGDAPPREMLDLAGARQITAEQSHALLSAIRASLAGAALNPDESFQQALQRANREMEQDEVARGIIEYAELDACRSALLRAKSEGTSVDDLPPGMTLDEAIEMVTARIAEHDRYRIWMEDGYLVKVWPEAGSQDPDVADPGTKKPAPDGTHAD